MKRAYALALLTAVSIAATAAMGQTPEKKKAGTTAGRIADGYNELKWGASPGSVKSGVKGKIVYTDEKKIIRSRDGDIEYLYGFFYRETAPAKDEKGAPAAPVEGKLYYVALQFPYLSMADVKKKFEEKYGPPTGESLTNNQGALIWDAEKTSIILWVDRYENNPFCRKITYVGKDIAKELTDYRKEIFSSAEIEILKKLAP